MVERTHSIQITHSSAAEILALRLGLASAKFLSHTHSIECCGDTSIEAGVSFCWFPRHTHSIERVAETLTLRLG